MKSVILFCKVIYWVLAKWASNPHQSYLLLLKRQNKYFAQLAAKAMQWRGYSSHPIHPKHIFDEKSGAYVEQFIKPGINFLDVGSGSGSVCLKACQTGVALSVGIEYNPDNVRLTLDRAKELGVEVQMHQFDLEKTPYPFEDDSFDLVNFSDVLEHLNKRVECLKELKRIKKSDAPIIISIPNAYTTWKKRLRRAGVDSRDDTDHKIEYSRDGLYQEINEAGLKIDSELLPIVPSFPWHGIFALSAAVSPALYRRLQTWKYEYAKRNPEESMGWVFHVR
jgi:SAM-dependent methyltransferase